VTQGTPVGVIDLGTGNLFSVLRGLERAGGVPQLVRTGAEVNSTTRVVLPGVGSFADVARRARALGLAAVVTDYAASGRPVLGICLGMQLLFDEGEEDGPSAGLGVLPGRVTKLHGGEGLAVPHVGWQRLEVRAPCALLPDRAAAPWFYFSHSYRAEARPEHVCAFVTHGDEVPAVVARGRVFGIQPHPEKSGEAGTALLRRFLALESES
jgi:glutamine amidotransferase